MAAKKRGLPRALLILLAVAACTVLLAAVGATVISKVMWGYWIARPGPDSRAVNAPRVTSVTRVLLAASADGMLEFIPGDRYEGPGWYDQRKAKYPQEFEYYLLDDRILHELEARGTITGVLPSLDQQKLNGLLATVKRQGRLVADDPGYDQLDPHRAHGVICELVGTDGEPLLIISWCGGEVSNDHLPFYEHLFAGRPGGPLTLVSREQFYFDIAGLEGAEFPRIFLVLSVVGLVLTIPLLTLVLVLRRLTGASAVKRGLCPACKYDLRGDYVAGCPECGWGRGEHAAEQLELSRYSIRWALLRACSRPPMRISFVAGASAAALLLAGTSTPGHSSSMIWWGYLLGIIVLLVAAVKLVGCLIAGRRRAASGSTLIRFGVIAAMAVVTIYAYSHNWALRGRFALSRSAFDREVESALNSGFKGTGKSRLVGLYWSVGTIKAGPGVAIMVPGDNEYYTNAFITFPDGKPDVPEAFGSRLECTPIGEGWYLYRYLDSDRNRGSSR